MLRHARTTTTLDYIEHYLLIFWMSWRSSIGDDAAIVGGMRNIKDALCKLGISAEKNTKEIISPNWMLIQKEIEKHCVSLGTAEKFNRPYYLFHRYEGRLILVLKQLKNVTKWSYCPNLFGLAGFNGTVIVSFSVKA